ncbi:MAG: diguanylate cyclase [Thiotrichales bacterium]|nr:diguanylate cyclase [Thiotrichales bacterium]
MKKPLKLYLVLLLALIAILTVAAVVYGVAKHQLYDKEILNHQKQLHENMQSLLTDQQNNAITLALSLTENPLIQEVLINPDDSAENRKKIATLVKRINQQSDFENLWLQLINLKGDSVYRSWTEKTGDNLLKIRPEIQDMLLDPKPKKVMSVGKFALSFKSMSPVFDEQFKLLGVVELITQFTPMTKELFFETGVSSVLLVDKSYKKQLTRVDQNSFLNEYFVANTDAPSKLISLLRNQDLQGLLNSKGYVELNGYVVRKWVLNDENGRVLAYWLTFMQKNKMSFENASWVLQKYIFINIAAILLLLLLTLQFINNRQANTEKRYFRQIIDSVSDIVYITNYKKIVDSNSHFFEFYDEFEDIEAFLSKYTCVCDTFVKEDGFLQRTINGEYWIDYILKRPYDSHKAKILRHGKTHIFQFKIKPMQVGTQRLFNVLMQDITRVEEFKERLQKLTVTDELTGVGNRLACNESLHHEIERAHRYKTHFSIIMLDVDHFKLVNDNFGHDVGDVVLKEVASVIFKTLRDIDKVCRYGGEEFLVLLPETDKHSAVTIAERIRLAVSELSTSEVPTHITISLGVANLTNWDTEQTFVKRADQALYRAKDLGRNRVEVDELTAVSEQPVPDDNAH